MITESTPNLSVDEIHKFDALAQEWWNPEGPMRALHQLNPLRVEFMQRHMSFEGKKILDVGCGAGILSECLAELGAKVTAIDMSANVLRVAREHADQKNLTIDYRQILVEEFESEEKFDGISCMELLEHVPSPQRVIEACAGLLKPGGLVFFSTLNRTFKSYALAIIAAEYVLNILPKGTHSYAQFIRPSELNHWAEASGLELLELQGVSYQALSRCFNLSPSVEVNYMMCFRLHS